MHLPVGEKLEQLLKDKSKLQGLNATEYLKQLKSLAEKYGLKNEQEMLKLLFLVQNHQVNPPQNVRKAV